jgi:hypothetical protein
MGIDLLDFSYLTITIVVMTLRPAYTVSLCPKFRSTPEIVIVNGKMDQLDECLFAGLVSAAT